MAGEAPAGYENVWPGAYQGRALAPVNVDMDRRTGQMLIGWPATQHLIETLFTTRYHERVLRYWVGSFTTHLLGKSGTKTNITRFFWAIITAIDLWEPTYDVREVHILRSDGARASGQELNDLTTTDKLRQGHLAFETVGVYMPRGHLGDRTPDSVKKLAMFGEGVDRWRVGR